MEGSEIEGGLVRWPPTKAIVFDFDGVLVRRSEFFKHEAWEELFKTDVECWNYFEEAEKKYGQGRGGDRFDIIREVLTKKHPADTHGVVETRVQEIAQRFDEIVQRKIMKAKVDPADVATLERLSKKYALYVNSATPKDVLEITIASLGLSHLFKGVLGRPLTKSENFTYVAATEGITSNEILFVGDGASDYKAARESRCRFVGLHNDWNNWREGGESFPVLRGFEQIENWTSI